jgi:Family of unknown function (DUF6335)
MAKSRNRRTAARKAAGKRKAAKKTARARKMARKVASRAARKSSRRPARAVSPRRKRLAKARPKPRAKAARKAAKKPSKAAKKVSKSAVRAAATRGTKPPARPAAKKQTPAPSAPAPSARPARAAKTARAAHPVRKPALDRERRRLPEASLPPTPPSSLDLDQRASAARSGRREIQEHLSEHTETGPVITAGDVDANWETAYSTGDEAPGGDNPTPDQDVVDEIGRSLGLEYEDNEELKGADKVEARDRHRWELDPASSEDYEDRD